MKKLWNSMLLVPVAALVGAVFVDCNADVEVGCEDGTCTSVSAATGFTPTGEGGAAPCKVPTSDDVDKHGFPDDVYAVLQAKCWLCHTHPACQNGAPHPFDYYDNTQTEYYMSGTKWWEQMEKHAICADADDVKACDDSLAPSKMPQNGHPMPECQMAVLRQWLSDCHGPGGCPKGTGTATEPAPSEMCEQP